MEERKVKGRIAYWTKEAKEENTPVGSFYKMSFHLKEDDEKVWHELFSENKEALEKLKESAPRGSLVEFLETKSEGSSKWLFKAGSFNIIEKGEEVSKTGFSKPFSGKTREERDRDQAQEVNYRACRLALDLVIADKVSLKDFDNWADYFEKRIITPSSAKTDVLKIEEEDVE